MVDVQDVVMSNGGSLQWSVNGNELRIGWFTDMPMSLNAGDNLLTLKLKTKATYSSSNEILFSLAGSALNELADGQFEVISNAVVSIDAINATSLSIQNQNLANGLSLSNQPNPFNGSTMINYNLPFEGKVSLEVYNYMGSLVKVLVSEQQTSGYHSLIMDAATLPSGIYMATLTVKNENNQVDRTIKLVNNR